MTTRTRPMVEGALLTAAAVVLGLLGTYLPIAGPVFTLALPLPVVLVFVRHGWRAAVLSVAAAGLLLGMIAGPLNAALTAIVLGSMGLALGWSQRRKLGAGWSILVAAGGGLVVFGANLAIFRLFLGQDVLQQMVQAFRQAADQVTAVYSSLGVPAAAQEQLRQLLQTTVTLLPDVLLAGFVAAAVFYAFLQYLVMHRVLRRLGYPTADLPPFDAWRLPPAAVAGWAAGVGCLYLAQRTGAAGWKTVGLNLSLVFQILYTVAGLSFGYFLLRRFRVQKAFAVLLLAFVALNPLLQQLAVWAGIFESVFGYRELLRRRAPQGGST